MLIPPKRVIFPAGCLLRAGEIRGYVFILFRCERKYAKNEKKNKKNTPDGV
jgi:hypothetical protein